MDVLMGLLAAVCWGATDFLVGVNARAVGVKRAVFFGQFLGLLLMGMIVVMSASQWDKLISAPWRAIGMGVIASLCTVVGALALSKSFAIGKTAVVAPLVTSYGVFTTLLAWLSGDALSVWQVSGIFVCFFGVLLASRSDHGGDFERKTTSTTSVGFALLAAMLYGMSFWIQGKFALPALGPVNMLALGYAVGVIFLIPEAFRLQHRAPIRFKTFGSLCGASLFNLGGFSAFSWGALSGSVSVVTVISTLSGGVAAVLGYFFYRERLSVIQLGGISLVLLGAVLLHLYG
ncbi:DMT family transporter [Pseudomonas fulva]|uniref:DMT family transporter n=1 Tax=Pseudomonas fulva TaxID=47880 RepID=UPI0018A936D8|nr:DMT family transporter [Pseudomonas fulva]MBF8673572.1 DMT family transporter [Pseudomonas fulva]MBF8696254.1 DMT family transporter [Pseudomonas fulva]